MKRINGYTLTELVAVIVILVIAISMTIAAVLPQLIRAKKESFIDEANNISKSAINKFTNEGIAFDDEDDVYDHNENIDEDEYIGRVCYNLDSLKNKYIKRLDSKYKGSVEVCYSSRCLYRTKIWLTNGKYYLDGARDVVIMSDLLDDTEKLYNCGNKK